MTDTAHDVRVLHRDADLLVLWKPAGLPTTSPDGRGCLTEIAEQLDPEAPRLHASSRLDAEVTGAVTFARTTRAIEGLLAARRAGQYERYYLGLAIGAPSPAEGEFAWPIERDPRDPRKRIASDRAPIARVTRERGPAGGRERAPRDSGILSRGSRDDAHGRHDEARRSRDDGRGASERDEARGSGDDGRGPRDDGRGPRDDGRGPRDDGRGARERDAARGARDRARDSGRRAADSGMHKVGRADKAQLQDALTRYRVLRSLPMAALLLLSPQTGRTHQLRVHVAKAGVPLLGDRHYGGPVRCTLPDGRVVRAGRVMLHCARVRLPQIGGSHAERVTVDAPLADDFQQVWAALGGDLDALLNALANV